MILTHLVLLSFLNGAGGSATPVVTTTVTHGGYDQQPRHRTPEAPRKKPDAWVREELERLFSDLEEAPAAVKREAVAAVRPVARPLADGRRLKSSTLPALERIDLASLAQKAEIFAKLAALVDEERRRRDAEDDDDDELLMMG